ncbi:hypothetical protein [Flavobacterium sp.]|uniref:hypothetical protein n=1 Tax=Flavobacterium sp. TaxID=239 RepID=UPI002B4AB97B|nr:hypothetical protein [Flavobacterium sp.]HLF52150.1 hypothetical protein [Flavobacterium sp.]
MNSNNTLLLVLFLLTQIAFGQTDGEKLIHGKIFADSTSVDRIDVVNLVNEKVTRTDKNGDFFILAKAGDVLVFSAINLDFKRKVIEEEDLKLDVVIINMTPKIEELNEVIVKNKSTEGISIISGQKSYTPAERKLYTAKSGILDRPINWISGRTAMLEKEVVVERKERLLSKIEILYEDKYYIETLKIPSHYIRDFQYYSIEDASFVAALKAKNKGMMRFLIGKLAVTYNQIIANEK